MLLATALLCLSPSVPFPFLSEGDQFRLEPQIHALCLRMNQLKFTDVEIPVGLTVDLILERIRMPNSAMILIDGEVFQGRLGEETSIWSGRVSEHPGSEVFLTLSPHGSWGWIDLQDSLIHWRSKPDPHDGWTRPTSSWILESDAQRERPIPFSCECEGATHRQPDKVSLIKDDFALLGDEPPSPVLEARLALETDFQLFQRFGTIEAAHAYILSLLGAINRRYRDQIGAIITPIYFGYHTDRDDGWNTQDRPNPNCFAILSEFRGQWRDGRAPVHGDIYHMLSGTRTQGGCANIDVLCDQSRAFSVTMAVNGATEFPVEPGPNNYDFVIMAHELGHNFGSIHTHEFCPPLDECATEPSWGPCQDEQRCTDQGTLMSYCGQCPGGFENHNTSFHPQVAGIMRAAAEQSCLRPFEGFLIAPLAGGHPGTHGVPKLQPRFDKSSETMQVELGPTSSSELGFLVLGTSLQWLSYREWLIGPAFDSITPFVTNESGYGEIEVPFGPWIDAESLYYIQGFFHDSGADGEWSSTRTLEIELILQQ